MSGVSFLFQAILVSMLLVMALAWLSIRLAVKINLIDYPSREPHKQHNQATPLAGGIALAATLLAGSLLFETYINSEVAAILAAAGVVFAFGLWDDYKCIRPIVKLAGQVLASVVLIRMGVSIQVFESPAFFLKVGPTLALYLDWALTIFWIVGITNAFNFVDSMDGLAVGLGGMAAAFFMLLTFDSQQPYLALQCALLIGTSIGLYFFNISPAMLFLGDAGAQTLGFSLAALAIAYLPQGASQSTSYIVPVMVMGVPIFDSALIVISRLRRKLPVYAASRDHTYHRLIYLGLPPARAVLIMQGATLALDCLAFILLPQAPLAANLIFIALLLTGIALIYLLDQRKLWDVPYHLNMGRKAGSQAAGDGRQEAKPQVLH